MFFRVLFDKHPPTETHRFISFVSQEHRSQFPIDGLEPTIFPTTLFVIFCLKSSLSVDRIHKMQDAIVFFCKIQLLGSFVDGKREGRSPSVQPTLVPTIDPTEPTTAPSFDPTQQSFDPFQTCPKFRIREENECYESQLRVLSFRMQPVVSYNQ